jgi:putative FmdB family regulatory protein
MPLYEYRCNSCEHEFDAFSFKPRSADEMSPECPECGSTDAERLISSVRVHAPARRLVPDVDNVQEEAARRQLNNQRQLDDSLRNLRS